MAAIAQMDNPVSTVGSTATPSVAPSMNPAVIPAVAFPAVEPVANAAINLAVDPAVDPAVVTVDDELAVSLECSLCPKKPKFSDASHLLTHISSKAHLHQKFNTELKAKSDTAASDRLGKFEKWYADNNIERLLAERLSTKNKGKAAPRRSRAAATPVSFLPTFEGVLSV
jgi:hypothetical protein